MLNTNNVYAYQYKRRVVKSISQKPSIKFVRSIELACGKLQGYIFMESLVFHAIWQKFDREIPDFRFAIP